MKWHPSDALASGAAVATADGWRLTLEPGPLRVEMVGTERYPLGEMFSASFGVRALAAPAGVPMILWQMHDGTDAGGLNPMVALECQDSTARVVYRHHVQAPVVKANVTTEIAPVGHVVARWNIAGRLALDGTGALRVRRNGVLLLDYAGPLGYNHPGVGAYQKRGIYSWVARTERITAEVST